MTTAIEQITPITRMSDAAEVATGGRNHHARIPWSIG
jgi:hypothetical protein